MQPLTVGQIQGNFQLKLVYGAGHSLHEDQPLRCSEHILTFGRHFGALSPMPLGTCLDHHNTTGMGDSSSSSSMSGACGVGNGSKIVLSEEEQLRCRLARARAARDASAAASVVQR